MQTEGEINENCRCIVVVFNQASVMFKNCFKSKCKLLVKVNWKGLKGEAFANESRNDDIFNILADNY